MKIVQRGTELIKPFPAKLRTYAARELQRRGVDLHLGAGVAKVLPDCVELTDGTIIRSDLTVWAAGVAPRGGRALEPPARGRRPHPRGRRPPGRGPGGPLRGRGHRDLPAGLPQLAQPAIQSGKVVGRNVRALVEGRPTTSLTYLDKGTMAVIGRRAAVADIAGKLRLTRGARGSPGCSCTS
ncbi:FAD-dependent oxidoreductase [Oerskovia sp. M15]